MNGWVGGGCRKEECMMFGLGLDVWARVRCLGLDVWARVRCLG